MHQLFARRKEIKYGLKKILNKPETVAFSRFFLPKQKKGLIVFEKRKWKFYF